MKPAPIADFREALNFPRYSDLPPGYNLASTSAWKGSVVPSKSGNPLGARPRPGTSPDNREVGTSTQGERMPPAALPFASSTNCGVADVLTSRRCPCGGACLETTHRFNDASAACMM